ncbi:hypothetical protein PsW74_02676 [Pseudovibrio sp. W74]|nr:hypothetical protein PsW74_02676 [Pseudovibrio sp. W74]
MYGAGGYAPEIRSDVASVSKARAVAEQEASDHCSSSISEINFFHRIELSGQPSCNQSPEHNAEVHDGCGIGKDRSFDRPNLPLPVRPGLYRDTNGIEKLCAPECEAGCHAPWALQHNERKNANQRQHQRTQNIAPLALKKTGGFAGFF